MMQQELINNNKFKKIYLQSKFYDYLKKFFYVCISKRKRIFRRKN